jgi:hypothetical protein
VFVAYIDPGSGSMLLQVILAGVLAGPFFVRRAIGDVWRRIRGEGDDRRQPPDVREESDSKP